MAPTVDGVPAEILRIIFELYIPPPKFTGPSFYHVRHGPWPISHVNRKWRGVCHSTPKLWSNFKFSWDDRNPGFQLIPADRLLEILRFRATVYLQHSRGYQLAIALFCPPKEIEEMLMQLLWPLHSSWRKFGIRIAGHREGAHEPQPWMQHALANKAAINMRSLSTLTLDTGSTSPPIRAAYTTLFNVFTGSLPVLTTAKFKCAHEFRSADIGSFPWSQIRTLQLHECSHPFMDIVLPRVSNVTLLDVWEWEAWDPDSPQDFPHVWGFNYSGREETFLPYVRAPNLRALRIIRDSEDRDDPLPTIEPLVQLIDHSHCQILDLDWMFTDTPALIQALPKLPQLRHLNAVLTSSVHPVISALIVGASDDVDTNANPLCPRLERLFLEEEHDGSEEARSESLEDTLSFIVQLLRARCNISDPRLRVGRFILIKADVVERRGEWFDPETAWSQTLANLREGGFNFAIEVVEGGWTHWSSGLAQHQGWYVEQRGLNEAVTALDDESVDMY